MSIYFYIEERYCVTQKRNVAIECRCEEDGSTDCVCLNKECADCQYCRSSICE